jgi:hypothetical protein
MKLRWPRWGVQEDDWRGLAWWQKVGTSVFGLGGAILTVVFGLIALALVLLLIGSLGYHAFIKGDLGHEGDHEARTPARHRSIFSGGHSIFSEAENENIYSEGGSVNPHPLKENGEPSSEFEPEDIERAESAPPSVRRYCEGAVSEAQEVGCLSHVAPSEVP